MGSIHSEFTDNIAIVGTDKVYAAIQNFGAKRGELGILKSMKSQSTQKKKENK